MPDGTKTYKVGNDTYDIPEEKVSSFIQKYPDAQEMKSYIVDKDTFDIPLDKEQAFLTKYPKAKPTFEVKKKELSDSEGITLPLVGTPAVPPSEETFKQKPPEITNPLTKPIQATEPPEVSFAKTKEITQKQEELVKNLTEGTGYTVPTQDLEKIIPVLQKKAEQSKMPWLQNLYMTATSNLAFGIAGVSEALLDGMKFISKIEGGNIEDIDQSYEDLLQQGVDDPLNTGALLIAKFLDDATKGEKERAGKFAEGTRSTITSDIIGGIAGMAPDLILMGAGEAKMAFTLGKYQIPLSKWGFYIGGKQFLGEAAKPESTIGSQALAGAGGYAMGNLYDFIGMAGRGAEIIAGKQLAKTSMSGLGQNVLKATVHPITTGSLFGGLTAAEGGDWKDIRTSVGMGIALGIPGFAGQMRRAIDTKAALLLFGTEPNLASKIAKTDLDIDKLKNIRDKAEEGFYNTPNKTEKAKFETAYNVANNTLMLKGVTMDFFENPETFFNRIMESDVPNETKVQLTQHLQEIYDEGNPILKDYKYGLTELGNIQRKITEVQNNPILDTPTKEVMVAGLNKEVEFKKSFLEAKKSGEKFTGLMFKDKDGNVITTTKPNEIEDYLETNADDINNRGLILVNNDTEFKNKINDKLLGKLVPEIYLSDNANKLLDKIDKAENVLNTNLEDLHSEIMDNYIRLEKTKEAPSQKNNIELINNKLKSLESLARYVDHIRQVQEETGTFYKPDIDVSEFPKLKKTIKEVQDAESIRKDEGQIPEGGIKPVSSQDKGSEDLQQPKIEPPVNAEVEQQAQGEVKPEEEIVKPIKQQTNEQEKEITAKEEKPEATKEIKEQGEEEVTPAGKEEKPADVTEYKKGDIITFNRKYGLQGDKTEVISGKITHLDTDSKGDKIYGVSFTKKGEKIQTWIGKQDIIESPKTEQVVEPTKTIGETKHEIRTETTITPKTAKGYFNALTESGISKPQAVANTVLFDIFARREAKRTGVTKEEIYKRQEFTTQPPEKSALRQYIGENANLKEDVRNNLNTAIEMDSKKESIDKIRTATGWFKGTDNKWRYETDDSSFKLNKAWLLEKLQTATDELSLAKLKDVSGNFDELVKLYPELKDLYIGVEKSDVNYALAYNEEQGYKFISINSKVLTRDQFNNIEKYLKHEIQHFIQSKEGFALGSNYNLANESLLTKLQGLRDKLSKESDKTARDNLVAEIQNIEKNYDAFLRKEYEKFAGEIEARNVTYRSNLSKEERRVRPPELDNDVSSEDAILLYNKEKLFGEEGKLYQYIGENAQLKKNVLDNLDIAREMEKTESAESVRLATGWFKGKDGKWRYETEPLKITTPTEAEWNHIEKELPTTNHIATKAENYIDLTEIKKLYPQIKDFEIAFIDNPEFAEGSWTYKNDILTIIVNTKNYGKEILQSKSEGFRETIRHETQHFIQRESGFVGGAKISERGKNAKMDREKYRGYYQNAVRSGNKSKIATSKREFDKYSKIYDEEYTKYSMKLGEVEARDVANRGRYFDDRIKIYQSLGLNEKEARQKSFEDLKRIKPYQSVREIETDLSDVEFQDRISLEQKEKGWVQFQNSPDGKAIEKIVVGLTNPDVSTAPHETITHPYLEARILEARSGDKLSHSLVSDVLQAYNSAKKAKYTIDDLTPNSEKYVKVHEFYANEFERYVKSGMKASTPRLQRVFDALRDWFTDIFKSMKGVTDAKLEKVFKDMFGEEWFEKSKFTKQEQSLVNKLTQERDRYKVGTKKWNEIQGKIEGLKAGKSYFELAQEESQRQIANIENKDNALATLQKAEKIIWGEEFDKFATSQDGMPIGKELEDLKQLWIDHLNNEEIGKIVDKLKKTGFKVSVGETNYKDEFQVEFPISKEGWGRTSLSRIPQIIKDINSQFPPKGKPNFDAYLKTKPPEGAMPVGISLSIDDMTYNLMQAKKAGNKKLIDLFQKEIDNVMKVTANLEVMMKSDNDWLLDRFITEKKLENKSIEEVKTEIEKSNYKQEVKDKLLNHLEYGNKNMESEVQKILAESDSKIVESGIREEARSEAKGTEEPLLEGVAVDGKIEALETEGEDAVRSGEVEKIEGVIEKIDKELEDLTKTVKPEGVQKEINPTKEKSIEDIGFEMAKNYPQQLKEWIKTQLIGIGTIDLNEFNILFKKIGIDPIIRNENGKIENTDLYVDRNFEKIKDYFEKPEVINPEDVRIGSEVRINFAGGERTGKVIEKTGDKITVEDENGAKYNVKKSDILGEGEKIEGGKGATISKSLESKAEPIKASDIMAKVQKVLGVPIRIGKIRTKRFAGIFKIKPEIVRLQEANDLATMTHEVAHFIDKKTGIRKVNFGKDERNELRDLDYDQKQRRIHEGFAEFVRHFITSEDASTLASKFYDYFTNTFLPENKKISDIIYDTKAEVTKWREQGSLNRVLSQIDFDPTKSDTPLREKFTRFVVKTRGNITNRLAPLEYVVQKILKESGKTLRPSEDPAQIAKSLAKISPSVAREFIMEGAFDFRLNKIGKSLKEVVEPVYDDIENAIAYAYAKHAITWLNRGLNPGIAMEDAQYVLKNNYKPEYEQFSKDFTEFSDHLIDYIVDAGGLSRESADFMRQKNPFYIPLKRTFVDEKHLSKGRGYVDLPNPIKKAKGSGRNIEYPLASMIKMTEQILSVADKSRVARALADMADNFEGMGKWIEKVPPPVEAKLVKLEQLKQQIEEAGGILDDAEMDKVLTIFSQGSSYYGKDNIVAIVRNGKREFYQLDPLLYDAMKGMDNVTLPAFINYTFGTATRLVRLGATGIRAGFSLLTNPIRDIQTYVLQSEHTNFRPDKPIKAVWEKLMGKSNYVQAFKRSGGEMAQPLGLDRKMIENAVEEVLADSKQRKALNIVKHPIEALRRLMSFPEAGVRLAEFEAVMKKYEPKIEKAKADGDLVELKKLQEDARIEASNAANEVTVNFKRAGTYGAVLNQIIPFFNPSVQGLSRMGRTIYEHPARSGFRAVAAMTIPTLVLWWLHKDEDWYKNLPSWQKYGFWNFKIGDTIVRLPKPFEWGFVFAGIPEGVADAIYRSNPDPLKKALKTSMENISPPLMPALIKPAMESYFNWDIFRERPIVSESQKGLLPPQQYSAHTSIVAKEIGQILNLSPQKIDHLLSGYSGGLAIDILNAFPKEYKELADIPIAGRLFTRETAIGFGGENVQDFYELYKRLNSIERTKSFEKKKDIKVKNITEKDNIIYSHRGMIQGTVNLLKSLREKQDKINSSNLDRDTKQRLVKELNIAAAKAAEKPLIDMRRILSTMEESAGGMKKQPIGKKGKTGIR